MADTMTLEQVRSNMRDAMNSVLKDDTRRIVVDWYNAIDAAIKQREQDRQDKQDTARFCWWFGNVVDGARAEVCIASLQTTHGFNIDDWRREIDAAMAKESGNG